MSIDCVNGFTGKCMHCRYFVPLETPKDGYDGLCYNKKQWPKHPGLEYSLGHACFLGELRDDLRDEVQTRLEDYTEVRV